MNPNDIKQIKASLSNIYDWESQNLEEDFVDFLAKEIPSLDRGKVRSLFRAFDQIPAKDRDSVSFNYESFIEKHLEP